jgi:predicted transcriptional regulator
MDRSDTPRCDAFLSVKLPQNLKDDVRELAEARGVTLSELVRRQLRKLVDLEEVAS